MKVINLFGSAGTGKSTTAAGLFFLMKSHQYNVELVTEYAKDLVWQDRKKTFNDQYYISAKQNHRLEVLRDKVDYAITDSPLLLGLIYSVDGYYKNFKPVLKEIFDSYDNVNFFLERVKPYNPVGRNQDEKQANHVATRVRKLLVNEKIQHVELNADDQAPQKIYNIIQAMEHGG